MSQQLSADQQKTLSHHLVALINLLLHTGRMFSGAPSMSELVVTQEPPDLTYAEEAGGMTHVTGEVQLRDGEKTAKPVPLRLEATVSIVTLPVEGKRFDPRMVSCKLTFTNGAQFCRFDSR